MEKIEKILPSDEKILWKDVRNENIFAGSNIITGWIVIHTVFTLGFYIVSIFIETLQEFSLFIYLFYIVITGFLIAVMIAVNIEVKSYGISREELKNYQEIYIITNKRWIQKNCKFNKKVDPLKFQDGAVEKIEDISFVNLDFIQSISIYQTRGMYNIGFYTEKNPKSETLFGLDVIGRAEYEEFLKIFKSQVSLGNETKDEYGGIIYKRD